MEENNERRDETTEVFINNPDLRVSIISFLCTPKLRGDVRVRVCE